VGRGVEETGTSLLWAVLGGTGGQRERELQDGGCVDQGAGYWE
jgi:hypothetical protein